MLIRSVNYLELALGAVGVVVIVWGVVITVGQLVALEFHRLRGETICRQRDILRLHLGSYLLFGLEILLAADIVRTIVAPSLQELAILGSIVAIRTVLNYFLSKELGAHRCEDDAEATSERDGS